VDNPITLPNPRQNIQDSLRIYDSKPVLSDLWITMQGASSVASLAASYLRFLTAHTRLRSVLLFSLRSEGTRAMASPALETKRSGTHQNAEASALIFAPAFGLPPFERERQGSGNLQANS
jgi:hypothetical protein